MPETGGDDEPVARAATRTDTELAAGIAGSSSESPSIPSSGLTNGFLPV